MSGSREYQVGDLRSSIVTGDWGQPSFEEVYRLELVSQHTFSCERQLVDGKLVKRDAPLYLERRVRCWVLVDRWQIDD